MERASYTVTELNNHIKELFDGEPSLAEVCVRGELSNYKIYPSGHHYFTLKDSESSLRCVMFKSSAVKLRFRPENGMRATVFGRVTVYQRDGAYQLYCGGIIPEGTGDLQIAFQQLKDKLSKEGLFASEHKKPLPEFPHNIAIVTSSAGAAIHDMIRILGRRWPMAKLLVLPVRVQGTEAPLEIAGAIKYVNDINLAQLIITGRGGGSLEDLWAFNDERLARAIYASRIPVISAVGHEPDVTIADYVADARASTPSNAAEIAVPDQNEMKDAIASYEIRCNQALRKKLSQLDERLASYKTKRVLTDPTIYIDDRYMELDRRRERMVSAEERLLAEKKQNFVSAASKLDAMSPLRVLSRGYSIAIGADGKSIKNADELSPGDNISLRFAQGGAECAVKRLTK